jgi:hypothetical protein
MRASTQGKQVSPRRHRLEPGCLAGEEVIMRKSSVRTLITSGLSAMVAAFGFAAAAHASAADMVVYDNGYPGCDWSVETNHFELAPGESTYFEVDMSNCTEEFMGGAMYIGYKTTKNSSRPLESRDGISLAMHDVATGEEIDYAALDGYNGAGKMEQCFVVCETPHSFFLSATNTGRKTKKIRLVFRSGL